MLRRHPLTAFAAVILCLCSCAPLANAQLPNQLAYDLKAGEVPSLDEVSKIEKEVAAKPDDMRSVRKLAKAYFFQFFGDNDASYAPKAIKTFERSLVLAKDDPESMAYLGSLHILSGSRLFKTEPVKQKAEFDLGLQLIKTAEKLAPRDGAVVSVASASYLWLPDSYGMVPHVIEILEGLMKGMGLYFKKFAHHGQQRILLTLGQAYARTGQPSKAQSLFEEGLRVNGESDEAGLLKAELAKLKK
jgi:tetratricopeptide (TPR) repeat protein